MILRIVILLIAMMFTFSEGANAARPQSGKRATGIHDARYAAIVLDPQTGEILHSQNADARRYPASLTKMMTLYLLFEDIKSGKVKKNTKMRVSHYAAQQPQTNIGLKAGERISVQNAIKALVVRSANDVAVVVAEHLEGSTKAFAARATKTARALGMQRTTFQNPHGLPDSRQVTTAHDMARLGVALQRDFPEYYDYFATEKFSWKGASYYTHNRVLTGFSGVDGIKTGYINAAGFNLVTSIKRGGKPLVGAVLGGYTSSWRDERMKYLLSASYQKLAARGNTRSNKFYAQNLPLPRSDRQTIVAANETPATRQPLAQVASDRGIVQASLSLNNKLPANVPFRRISREALNYQSNEPQNATQEYKWGIQVGAFVDKHQAQKAVVTAIKLAPAALSDNQARVVDAAISGGKVHRARLENLSELQARQACKTLIGKNAPCFVYKAGNQNL